MVFLFQSWQMLDTLSSLRGHGATRRRSRRHEYAVSLWWTLEKAAGTAIFPSSNCPVTLLNSD